MAKTFDYLVPERFRDQVRVGTVVRVPLHGRRVAGWVVAVGAEPPAGVELKPIAKVTGWGPPPAILGLAEGAAWRGGGPGAPVSGAPPPPPRRPRAPAPPGAGPAPPPL